MFQKAITESQMLYAGSESEVGSVTVTSAPQKRPLSASWRHIPRIWNDVYKFAFYVILPLAIIIWVAHFLHSRDFGLYEDDWGRIPEVMGFDWHELGTALGHDIAMGPSQGRPLHPSLIQLFSFIGYKAGGLHGLYGMAFLILLTNAVLFYFVMKRVCDDQQFAFLGAVAFSVFPADTTQAFLTHAFGAQPAITLLLIALLLYISGWRVVY
jgi:hypothetical protein